MTTKTASFAIVALIAAVAGLVQVAPFAQALPQVVTPATDQNVIVTASQKTRCIMPQLSRNSAACKRNESTFAAVPSGREVTV
jgi:hypothetical protein